MSRTIRQSKRATGMVSVEQSEIAPGGGGISSSGNVRVFVLKHPTNACGSRR
ncbi:hypothetical protein RSAG8_04341, partial [Rhizoctonia solani AG-8 WAC10335]